MDMKKVPFRISLRDIFFEFHYFVNTAEEWKACDSSAVNVGRIFIIIRGLANVLLKKTDRLISDY